ncbi:unnamed protein product [Phytomonas sp. EM1]|nr:unnamed protein product [Phytomonas sp. EM1]|eukprot:CCW59987.1 unnamed protein product [Phytomonas sp. isolate EM1]
MDINSRVGTDVSSSRKKLMSEKEEISLPETDKFSEKGDLDEIQAVCVQAQARCNGSTLTGSNLTAEDEQKTTRTHKTVNKNPSCESDAGTYRDPVGESCPRLPNWVEASCSPTASHSPVRTEMGEQNSTLIDFIDLPFVADSRNDELIEIPFTIQSETFKVPIACPDDLLEGEDSYWRPGKPLRISFTTWNMAKRRPRMDEVESVCIHPNAHLIAVGTQENGHLVNNQQRHSRWVKDIASRCLKNQYALVGTRCLWGIHLVLFARRRDVAGYVSHVHGSEVRRGLFGICGNKGAVALALALSMTPRQEPFYPSPSEPFDASPVTPTIIESKCSPNRNRTRDTLSNSVGILNVPQKGILLPSIQPRHQSHTGVQNPSNELFCDVDNIMTPSPTPDMKLHLPKGLRAPGGTPQVRPLFCWNSNMRLETSSVGYKAEKKDNTTSVQKEIFLPSQDSCSDLSKQQTRSIGSLALMVQPQTPEKTIDVAPHLDQPSLNPPFLTLLLISAHMAPHQSAVQDRNMDYRHIVHKLRVGLRGKYHEFFKKLIEKRKKNKPLSENVRRPFETNLVERDSDSNDREGDGETSATSYSSLDKRGEPHLPELKPPSPSTFPTKGQNKELRHDVTEDFDFTIFGGDLNYRINGTRSAIESIVERHRNIRSILINNDQLTQERAKKAVFHHFKEGRINFRPTYKYEIHPSGSIILNERNFSRKKMRMPAYCDRILFKKTHGSSAGHVTVRLYTDVPGVYTSDHRPVANILDIDTSASCGAV